VFSDQADAHRAKAKAARERRAAKLASKKVVPVVQPVAAPVAKAGKNKK
jgi:hypothetical protein